MLCSNQCCNPALGPMASCAFSVLKKRTASESPHPGAMRLVSRHGSVAVPGNQGLRSSGSDRSRRYPRVSGERRLRLGAALSESYRTTLRTPSRKGKGVHTLSGRLRSDGEHHRHLRPLPLGALQLHGAAIRLNHPLGDGQAQT